jgi:hypothetical protein
MVRNEFFEYAPLGNPYDVSQAYLERLSDSEREAADYFSRRLTDAGPLASTVVIIPVAAQQESANIYHALSQYARQETDRSFTVVLGMNSPENLTSPAVQSSYSELNRARADFPNLDVRDVFKQYHDASIGMIRRDLWNGVMTAGMSGGIINAQNDILGINHDIDLTALPRHYIRAVQGYIEDPLQRTIPTNTQIRHSYHPDFPNISRYVKWVDHLYAMMDIGYEAGTVVPMYAYAVQGGIDPTSVTNEINDLLGDSDLGPFIKSGKLQTSPRRYIARLAAHGPDNIWTNDSFGNNDSCREALSGDDIDEKKLDDLLSSHNEKFLSRAILQKDSTARFMGIRIGMEVVNGNSASVPPLKEKYFDHMQKHLRLRRAIAARVMRSSVQRPAIADGIEAEFSDDRLAHFAQESLDNIILIRKLVLDLQKPSSSGPALGIIDL